MHLAGGRRDVLKPAIHKPAKLRIFHRESGMIGFFTYFSRKVKMASNAHETTSNAMMNGFPQPYNPPLDSTNDSRINPAVDIAAPA